MRSSRRATSPPLELLVALCRGDPAAEVDPGLLAYLRDDRFRTSFERLAGRHRVLGLVLTVLERRRLLGSLPPPVRSSWIASLAGLRRQAALWDLERSRVLAGLRRSGFDPVLLKGGALRATHFADPVERSIGDLDLLLPEVDASRAIRVLETMGYDPPSAEAHRMYRERYYHVPVVHRHGFTVEVHWSLLPPGWPVFLDPADVLDEARLVRHAGEALRVPRPEHMLLHVVSQAIKEPLRLGRLVDVDRIAAAEAPLDWELLDRELERAELGNAAAFCLQLCRNVLGSPVRIERLARSRPSFAARFHLALLRPVESLMNGRFDESDLQRKTITLWLIARARPRARFFAWILTGRNQPLKWILPIYRKLPERTWTLVSALLGPIKLGALIGYHVWLYLHGLAALTRASHRARTSFWSDLAHDEIHEGSGACSPLPIA